MLSSHGKLGASPGPRSESTIDNSQHLEKAHQAAVFKPKNLEELAKATDGYSNEFAEVIARVADAETPPPQFEVAAKLGVLELQPEQLKDLSDKKLKDLSAMVALLDDTIGTSLDNLSDRPATPKIKEMVQDLGSLQAELHARRAYIWLLGVYFQDVESNSKMALPEDKRQRRQMFEEILNGAVIRLRSNLF